MLSKPYDFCLDSNGIGADPGKCKPGLSPVGVELPVCFVAVVVHLLGTVALFSNHGHLWTLQTTSLCHLTGLVGIESNIYIIHENKIIRRTSGDASVGEVLKQRASSRPQVNHTAIPKQLSERERILFWDTMIE